MQLPKKLSTKVLVIVGVLFAIYSVNHFRTDFTIPNAQKVIHPKGLVVLIPPDYREKQIGNGFHITPKGNDFRVPIIIDVELMPKKAIDASLQTRNIAGKTIHYSIQEGEGGSGGATYDLTAYEFVDESCIVYTSSDQQEWGEPDFDLLWKIVANTRFKKP